MQSNPNPVLATATPKNQHLLGGKGLGLPFKKAVLMTLCLLSIAAAALSLLALPELNKALGIDEDASNVRAVSAYLQGNPTVSNTVRVADQHDPARAETLKISKENAQIAAFFAKKYRLTASEIEKYLHFVDLAAKDKGLDATLLMAVMSIESNLNIITESSAGAQGLMQVMTAVHLDKLAAYGGPHMAFDAQANIMVGATILADCIKLGGSVEMGLKCYVGATGPTDGGYGAKVLAEKERIEKARLGVFDFTANNKVLQDLGLIAAPVATDNNVNSAGAGQPSQTQSMVPTDTSSKLNTAPLAAPSPAPVPGLLPAQSPVTLPAPAVNAAALHHPNVDAGTPATGSKPK
jgi:soluble lytic murein transglycosylase-like protein